MGVKKFIQKRIYIKSIAISVESLKYIETNRGKKSKAGKLNEIIEFYKKYERLTKTEKLGKSEGLEIIKEETK